MKRAIGYLVFGIAAAIPLLLFPGCYTQMGTSRGDFDESYGSENQASDQEVADTTQRGDYDSARREFYNDSYYSSDYPAYGVGIGFGWRSPWYGYGYPWYDTFPYYGVYPYSFYSPWNNPWFGYYGGWGHGYWGGYYGGGYYGGGYGRGWATRRSGVTRTTGGLRGGYTSPGTGSYGVLPGGGRTGLTRGPASTGRSAIRGTGAPGTYTRGHGATRVAPRGGTRGTAGTSTGRSGGRGYSSGGGRSSGGSATSGGGGSRGGGGGGGSRGGGGGGGSRGGGGRR